MSIKIRRTYATRDDALDCVGAWEAFGDSVVIGDNGCYYWPTRGCTSGAVFAVSRGGASDGLVVLVTRTGERVTNGALRVRIDFPRDTGDAAGTLVFGDDEHVGGQAPAEWFGR